MDRYDTISRSSGIRFQLSLYKRCITRMGCGSHRMFPRLLPIHIQDCLYRNGSTNTVCYPQFLGLLNLQIMKRSLQQYKPYISLSKNMEHWSCPSRTALFVGRRFKYEDKNEERDRENTSHWQPMNYRAKLANASYRTARSSHRWFRRKSSSPCCGIFPENLALPEALAVTPS